MERECPKCGFLNTNADGSTTEICPQCGVIYAKAALALAQDRLAERQIAKKQLKESGERPMMDRALWFIAICGALFGLAQLIYTIVDAQSAPQQAAGTGIALALAVIPYCLARAWRAHGD